MKKKIINNLACIKQFHPFRSKHEAINIHTATGSVEGINFLLKGNNLKDEAETILQNLKQTLDDMKREDFSTMNAWQWNVIVQNFSKSESFKQEAIKWYTFAMREHNLARPNHIEGGYEAKQFPNRIQGLPDDS